MTLLDICKLVFLVLMRFENVHLQIKIWVFIMFIIQVLRSPGSALTYVGDSYIGYWHCLNEA